MVIIKKTTIIFTIFILAFPTVVKAKKELNFDKKKSAKFSYNFGEVKEGEKTTHTFKILNNSQFPWKIGKISTSCGCVTAELIGKRTKDKQIAPKKVLKIKIDIDTSGHKGSLDQFVYVKMNQQDESKILKLVMEGKVLKSTKNLKELIEKANFLQVDQEATDFSLPDLKNRKVSLSDYKGKVILLNFWTTWCPNCREERSYLEKLHQKFKEEDFILIAVDLRESKEKVKEFVKQYNLNFIHVLDKTGKATEKYKILGVPTSFIIDKEQKIVAKAIGLRRWSDNKEIINLFEFLLEK